MPAIRKARGVAPLDKETASPRTAKIPPPTIPPIPIEMASLSPMVLLSELFKVLVFGYKKTADSTQTNYGFFKTGY